MSYKKERVWTRIQGDKIRSEKRFIADADDVLHTDEKIDLEDYKPGCTIFKSKLVSVKE